MALLRMLLLCASAIAIFVTGVGNARQPESTDKEVVKPKGKPNRLARESSPYLLQHAHNPVDWFPWGPEAFERAKKENKLIFLSIGYSSCHWCHVMERESFSDVEIAKVMNENFVCIKVDREERPDVDDIYMTALSVTGIQGGWPLTMILTSEGKPIFGGTYFPPADRKVGDDTMPGMKSILATVIELNKKEHDQLLKQADHVADLTVKELTRSSQLLALVSLNRDLVRGVADAFEVDPEYGGTGNRGISFRGTKFPRPAVWSFLLSQAGKSDQPEPAKLVKRTLENIAIGGIFDHLGGGFHRYSTERTWTVPHFEKMLYDNAQLVELYSEAYRRDPDPLYRRVVAETIAFIKRELTAPGGGFYSALDADSDHKEGEFYVWTADEVKTALGSDADAAFFLSIYGGPKPNFEGRACVLRLSKPLGETAKELKLTEEQLLARLQPLKEKLLKARATRTRPFLDTKVIAGWNGQMIAGCARAGQVFRNPEFVRMAETAADFVLGRMRAADGCLRRVWGSAPGAKPEAKGIAFLDDYAYLIHGLLVLHEATGDKKWLTEAKALTDLTVRWYGDPVKGGFYFTPTDGEKLFARPKDGYDGVQPSGNSQMARNLLRLWQLTKEDSYRDRGVDTVKAFALAFRTAPTSLPTLAQALDEYLDAGEKVVTTGGSAAEAPKKPRESADVVAATLKLGESTAAGDRPFTLTLSISDGWHVYGNPVGVELLAAARTEVTVVRDNKAVAATVKYPAGTPVTDPMIGKIAVYTGRVEITGVIPAGQGEVAARVRLTACSDGAGGKPGICLQPSELKVKPAGP